MFGVMIFGLLFFILIFGLSVFTIKKGYAFKHTIDERPTQQEKNK
ncbi:YtzI protein [Psychrobacillus sp.]|nr:YtzI protein [Psychrobacillus sp.]